MNKKLPVILMLVSLSLLFSSISNIHHQKEFQSQIEKLNQENANKDKSIEVLMSKINEDNDKINNLQKQLDETKKQVNDQKSNF